MSSAKDHLFEALKQHISSEEVAIAVLSEIRPVIIWKFLIENHNEWLWSHAYGGEVWKLIGGFIVGSHSFSDQILRKVRDIHADLMTDYVEGKLDETPTGQGVGK